MDMKHDITTLNTKRVIAGSLKKLMRQKPFSKISVSEIIADCSVNRKTFYYHFEDIYALLKWIFKQEAIETVAKFDLIVDYEETNDFVMDYVEQNEYMIACAYDSIGRDEMKRFFYTDFIGIVSAGIDAATENMTPPPEADYRKFLSEFYTEALAGMLINWIKDDTEHDRVRTKEYLTRIIRITKKSLTGE